MQFMSGTFLNKKNDLFIIIDAERGQLDFNSLSKRMINNPKVFVEIYIDDGMSSRVAKQYP